VFQSVIPAAIIFVVTYIFIVTERVHRATAALTGAALILIFHIVSLKEAWVEYIDFNTLLLLIGMMIIVAITKRTGLFQYVAVKAAKIARGRAWLVLITLSAATAVLSAFLDNVTTVLLTIPMAILIADTLGKSPLPFLMAGILSANIGGTATLLGDPPNILVSSAAHFSFMDFIVNLAPIAIIIFMVTLLLLLLFFRRHFKVRPAAERKALAFKERQTIRDPLLLKKSLIILGLTLAAFTIHHRLNLAPSTIALGGAALLLFTSRINPEEIFKEIEWPVLFFFFALFILVGALEKVSIIGHLAGFVLKITTNPAAIAFIILWGSAVGSSLLSAVPSVILLIPLVEQIGIQLGLPPLEMNHLWWALALGACLGGNGTIMAAAANLTVVGISEKTRTPLTFKNYFKVGMPLTLVSLFIASIYIYFRYFS
jgi:Na+/H+ antiporter NhaD/arsenite permease-like protein